MDNKRLILKTFNNHLSEFLNDIIDVFSKEVKLLTTRTFLNGIMKVKSKAIITFWFEYIYVQYKKEIDENNFDFFLNKNYKTDVEDNDVIKGIEEMRIKIRKLSKNDREKSMQYVKNLTKLSQIYFS